jgi:alkanesulfonate monooxygenase SsuD/methylene tetrahydromethanopterin reductase-like flavin-dependent oxidoreductase (luciferase family)
MVDARCTPRPLQAHLPILVGGSGPRKTMRTVARHADGWNTGNVTPEQARDRLDILQAHCDEAGRDLSEIELTLGIPMIIRETVQAAEAARAAQLAYNGISDPEVIPTLIGPPATIAETVRPYRDLGFSTVIVRMPAPFDRETIDRLPEVLQLLGE